MTINVSVNGNPDRTSGFSDSNLQNNTATGVPSRRAALNGQGPQIITRLRAWASGRGATRTVTLRFGNARVSLSRSSAGSAQDTGFVNASTQWFIANGGSANFRLEPSGSFFFGRNLGAGGSISGTSLTGQITFGYSYVQSPTAPGAPSLSSPSSGRIDVSWGAPSDDGGAIVTGYRIQYSTSSNFSSPVNIDQGTSRSRTITGLTPGVRYYFRVAARNAVTNSANTTSVWSASRNIVVVGVLPSAPRNLGLSSPSPGSLTATWQAPSNTGDGSFQGYNIQFATNSSFTAGVINVTLGNVTSHTRSNLNFGTTYFVRVRARTSFGQGPYSNTASRLVAATIPNPPPACNASSPFIGGASVTWSTPTFNGGSAITGYRVDYSLVSNFSSGVTTLSLGVTNSTTISNLQQGATYFFRVRAVNAVGQSGNSPTASTLILGDPNVPLEFGPRDLLIENLGVKPAAFFSLQGHYAGFDDKGNVAEPKETFKDYVLRVNSPISESFEVLQTGQRGVKIYAQELTGETLYFYRQSRELSSLSTVRFKTFLNEQNLNMSWTGNPRVPSRYSGQIVNIDVDYDNALLELDVDFPIPDPNNPAGSLRDTAYGFVDISDICLTEENMVTVQYQRELVNATDFDHTISVNINCMVNRDKFKTITKTYRTSLLDAATQPWTISGNVRALVTSNTSSVVSPDNVYFYENTPNYSIDENVEFFGPAPSVRSNVWEYIKEATAALNFEVADVGGEFVVRPIGDRFIDVTNLVEAPSITPTSTFTGRSVDIEYTNAFILPEGLFYYSREDDNRVLQVSPGETITTTVQSKGSPNFVQQPVNVPVDLFLDYVRDDFFPQSAYGVIDTTNLPITPEAWAALGGRVSVQINNEIPGALDVTVVAPGGAIPGTTPPYSLAFSDGVNSFGALALVGSGIVDEVETLNLLTGANFEKTQQDVSSTISNPFVNTIQQAYDRGTWASHQAAGPVVELSGSLPTNVFSGFGLGAGSMIFYRDNLYRIVEVQYGRVSSSFTAVNYVTVKDFDESQDGATVGDHDELWAGSEVEDQVIFPFKGLDYNVPTEENNAN